MKKLFIWGLVGLLSSAGLAIASVAEWNLWTHDAYLSYSEEKTEYTYENGSIVSEKSEWNPSVEVTVHSYDYFVKDDQYYGDGQYYYTNGNWGECRLHTLL